MWKVMGVRAEQVGPERCRPLPFPAVPMWMAPHASRRVLGLRRAGSRSTWTFRQLGQCESSV